MTSAPARACACRLAAVRQKATVKREHDDEHRGALERRQERLRRRDQRRADEQEDQHLQGRDERAPRRVGDVGAAAAGAGMAARPSSRPRARALRRMPSQNGPATTTAATTTRIHPPRSESRRGLAQVVDDAPADHRRADHHRAGHARGVDDHQARRDGEPSRRRSVRSGELPQLVEPGPVERGERLERPRQRAVDEAGDRTRGADQPRRQQRRRPPRPRPRRDRGSRGSRPASTPTPAMMNENSPICARLMPAWIDVRDALAGEERRRALTRDDLADDDDGGEGDDGAQCSRDQRRIDQHADGDEEHRGEDVAHRLRRAARPASRRPTRRRARRRRTRRGRPSSRA